MVTTVMGTAVMSADIAIIITTKDIITEIKFVWADTVIAKPLANVRRKPLKIERFFLSQRFLQRYTNGARIFGHANAGCPKRFDFILGTA